MELIKKVNALIDSKKGKALTAKKVTVNGESVNNIPSSFKGYVQLPKEGVEKDSYDFNKVVESTDTFSRLTVDIQGSYQKNGKQEELASKSAVLWGGAINALQKKSTIIMDGEAVYAVIQ